MTPDETANTAREQVLNELLLRKQQRKKDWNKTSLVSGQMTLLPLK